MALYAAALVHTERESRARVCAALARPVAQPPAQLVQVSNKMGRARESVRYRFNSFGSGAPGTQQKAAQAPAPAPMSAPRSRPVPSFDEMAFPPLTPRKEMGARGWGGVAVWRAAGRHLLTQSKRRRAHRDCCAGGIGDGGGLSGLRMKSGPPVAAGQPRVPPLQLMSARGPKPEPLVPPLALGQKSYPHHAGARVTAASSMRYGLMRAPGCYGCVPATALRRHQGQRPDQRSASCF